MKLVDVVILLGELHIEGPIVVKPVTSDSPGYLVKYLSMSQFEPGVDPIENLAIYVPSGQSMPSRLKPIIRRAKWHKMSAPREARTMRRLTLNADATYYRTNTASLRRIDDALHNCDEGFSKLDFDIEGLDYGATDAENGRDLTTPTLIAHETAQWYLRDIRRSTTHFSYSLEFSSLHKSPANEAWERLWQTLTRVTTVSNEITVHEEYRIDPNEYKDVLLKGVTNSLEL